MGLGNRNAQQRHDTLAVQKQAVVSEDYADFRVKQRVMTCDGFPGVVAAVEDGPYAGTEGYLVELDNGMGGGLYRSADLAPINQVVADHHVATDDYPELGSILSDRPDIAEG